MKASVIIPAFNEECTVSKVVEACRNSIYVDDVIVIDDGSTDKTAEYAKNAGAMVLTYNENRGKSFAVMFGVRQAKNEVVLLLDADLIGFNADHADSLILPVMKGDVEATLGLFTKGRAKTDLAHSIAPWLSGQRCLKKKLLSGLMNYEEGRYAFEVQLNEWMKKNNVSSMKIPLEHVSHLTKEEKQGKKKGCATRMQMYKNIAVQLLFKNRVSLSIYNKLTNKGGLHE